MAYIFQYTEPYIIKSGNKDIYIQTWLSTAQCRWKSASPCFDKEFIDISERSSLLKKRREKQLYILLLKKKNNNKLVTVTGRYNW